MRRRTFFFLVVTALMGLATFFAGGQDARAQIRDCCTFTVDIDGFKDYCFPFKLIAYWDDGSVSGHGFDKNGIYTEQIPGKCPGLKCITLDEKNGPCIGIGEQAKYVINDCCFLVTVKVDRKGCIYIVIRPC